MKYSKAHMLERRFCFRSPRSSSSDGRLRLRTRDLMIFLRTPCGSTSYLILSRRPHCLLVYPVRSRRAIHIRIQSRSGTSFERIPSAAAPTLRPRAGRASRMPDPSHDRRRTVCSRIDVVSAQGLGGGWNSRRSTSRRARCAHITW